MTDILSAAITLCEKGIAVHWLKPRSKKPALEKDWPTAPVATPDSLRETYVPGSNVGIRPGKFSRIDGLYLQLLDADVRDETVASEAYAWLDAHWPEWRRFPIVQSGSGGSSRHIYFLTRQPYRSRQIARSTEKCMYRGREVWKWQLEIYGTHKQAAAPPSIHPDTGLPYRWLRPIDFDAIELGCAPILDESLIRSWGAQEIDTPAAPNENRLGLTLEEAEDILSKLDLAEFCEDRQGWLTVGMSLKHEFGEDGYEPWCRFSEQSDKYDPDEQRKVWRSFSGATANPVRMATLKAAARKVEIASMFDELTDDDDLDDLCGPVVPTTKQIKALIDEPRVQWGSKLDLNEDGGIRPTLHNLTLIIRNDPRTKNLPALNLFTQEIVLRGQPGKFKMRKESPKGTKQLDGSCWNLKDAVNGDLWEDSKDNAIRDVLEAPTRQGGYGLRITDRDLKAAIDIVARDNAFHPVREYIESTTWDGVERLETVFIRYLGAPDNTYSRSIARLVLLAGVTRIYEPGAKFDFALILEGMQGKRKSTFISLLAHRWFAELNCDFGDPRATIEMMQGAWVLEIPELSGFNKSDVRVIKGFISRTVDKGRLAYARRAQNFPRQCIFIGSTNDHEYLRDDTGGRRFWPLECRVDEIDTDSFEAEVDQLWAEAYAMYRAIRLQQPRGTLPLYLTDASARSTALVLQEDRRVESSDDAVAGVIGKWLDSPVVQDGFDDMDDLLGAPPRRNETSLIEIWCDCLGRDLAAYTQSQAPGQALSRAMRRLTGWTMVGPRDTPKHGRQRVYRRFGYTPGYGDRET